MNTLIIFIKYPLAGKVKTRLAKDVGESEAARIYSQMAKTIIENTSDPESYNTIIFYDPPEKEQEIKHWIEKTELQYLPQTGNTLGDRISSAFMKVYSSGADKAVIIGSDCIDVNRETINEAMGSLQDVDVVLGPAEDGGYYLLGLKRHIPEILQEIDWSTDRVLGQTLEKIKEKKLKYELLKTLKDIDTVEDLNGSIEIFVKAAEAK